MNIEYTEDGYLKLSVSKKNVINHDEIQHMNTNPYILPSFRDRYDADSILYHRGEYISLAQYFEHNILHLSELKSRVLQLSEAFLNLKNAGFEIGNIITELDYIFINPKTLKVKVVYCPVPAVVNEKRFQSLLLNICHGAKTEQAAILLGALLEQSNQSDFQLENFKASIEQLENQIEVQIKEIEKVVEVPVEVERIVEKPVEVEKIIETVVEKQVPTSSGGVVCLVTVISISITTIILPYVLNLIFDENISMKPKISNYVLYLIELFIVIITYYLTRPKKDNDGRTIQPTQTIVTGMDSSILRKDDEYSQMRKSTISAENMQRETKQMDSKINRNITDEVSQARITRKNEKSINQMAQPMFTPEEEEGTAVLFGEAQRTEAYLIEEGKSSLMDRIFIDASTFVIGRDAGVSFRINEHAISKKHAQISCMNGQYYIKDLGSSNGTFVNEARLEANKETPISHGSSIKFGNKCFIFNRE